MDVWPTFTGCCASSKIQRNQVALHLPVRWCNAAHSVQKVPQIIQSKQSRHPLLLYYSYILPCKQLLQPTTFITVSSTTEEIVPGGPMKDIGGAALHCAKRSAKLKTLFLKRFGVQRQSQSSFYPLSIKEQKKNGLLNIILKLVFPVMTQCVNCRCFIKMCISCTSSSSCC